MTQQLILDLLSAPPPTLANFIVGDNRAAIDGLNSVEPGRAVYLWGPPGAGRSHLLHALSAQEGGTYFGTESSADKLRAVATSDSIPFRLIAVDNVERLDDAGQAALFALYNRWRESAASPQAFAILTAGDRAPLSMPLREDLRTRLGWDLVFRLELLSDHDRAQALKTQAAERGLQLSADVIGWILTHYARDMRQLSALLDALDRYSLQKKRAITLPLLKDLLATPQAPNSSTKS